MMNILFTSSILILAVMMIRVLFQGKISRKLQYAVWLVVAVKLLLVPNPHIASSFSVLNVLGNLNAYVAEVASGVTVPFTSYTTTIETSTDANPIGEENDTVDENGAGGNGTIAEDNLNIRQSETTTHKLVASDILLYDLLTLLMATGSLVMAVLMIATNVHFRRKLCKNRSKFESDIPCRLSVYMVEGIASPCLVGRSIYLTPDMTADSRKLRHIYAHEYSHFRHGDEVWSMLRCICLMFYWWHPLVWAAAYLSKQDCELACDESALKMLGEEERIPYGKTLLSLVTVTTRPKDYFTVSTTMTGNKKSMKQRVGIIAKKPKTFLSISILVLVILGLLVVATMTGELPPQPTEDDIVWNQLHPEELQADTLDWMNRQIIPNSSQQQYGVTTDLDTLYQEAGLDVLMPGEKWVPVEDMAGILIDISDYDTGEQNTTTDNQISAYVIEEAFQYTDEKQNQYYMNLCVSQAAAQDKIDEWKNNGMIELIPVVKEEWNTEYYSSNYSYLTAVISYQKNLYCISFVQDNKLYYMYIIGMHGESGAFTLSDAEHVVDGFNQYYSDRIIEK